MGTGNERNKKCQCESGKKFKNCCMGKNQGGVPIEVIEHFQKVRARQELLRSTGIHVQYVRPVQFQGRKIWALGNRVMARSRVNETFHEFIIEILKDTVGRDWLIQQSALPASERHFILIAIEKAGEWATRNENEHNQVPGKNMWRATPDGYTKSLISLAFDITSLIHKNQLPDKLLERLKSRDEYQGARYEIAIAAIFSRLNCDVSFISEENREKHCEFVATHRDTGSVLAVEVKSRRRPGVIHHPGSSSLDSLAEADVRRMFNEALQQNPKDTPFAVFIDVNLPLTSDIPLEKKSWVKEVKNLVAKKLKASKPQEYPLNAAFFTNFSYHYQTDKESERGESIGFIVPHPKFPPPNAEFFSYLQSALNNYGFIPNFDEDENLLM